MICSYQPGKTECTVRNGHKKSVHSYLVMGSNERLVNTRCLSETASQYFYKLSDKALPGLNFATFFAAICKAAPVLGLRPVLASLVVTENDPKPPIETRCPAAGAPPKRSR